MPASAINLLRRSVEAVTDDEVVRAEGGLANLASLAFDAFDGVLFCWVCFVVFAVLCNDAVAFAVVLVDGPVVEVFVSTVRLDGVLFGVLGVPGCSFLVFADSAFGFCDR